jgi:hypothetical protein
MLLCRRSPPAALADVAMRGQAPAYACGFGAALSFSLVLSYPGVGFDPSSGDVPFDLYSKFRALITCSEVNFVD